jgi:hypothetical protein
MVLAPSFTHLSITFSNNNWLIRRITAMDAEFIELTSNRLSKSENILSRDWPKAVVNMQHSLRY